MTERWNEQYPDDKVSDRSALRRAYKRAEEQLVSPWKNRSEHPASKGAIDVEDFNMI